MKQGKLIWLCYEITIKFFIHFFIQNLRKFFRRKENVAHIFAMKQNYIRSCSWNQEVKQCTITISCRYRNSSISKMELFVIKVNDWKLLTIVRRCPFLNVGGFLELSLGHTNFANFVYFVKCKVWLYICCTFITHTLMNIFYINIWFFELNIFQKHNH